MAPLETLRKVLANPDNGDPRSELIDILRAAKELVELPNNDFSWSSWGDSASASKELSTLVAMLSAGVLPDRLAVTVIFTVTGPMQELSLSSGWSSAFLQLAERYDKVEGKLWPDANK
jgi:hypothetical protein